MDARNGRNGRQLDSASETAALEQLKDRVAHQSLAPKRPEPVALGKPIAEQLRETLNRVRETEAADYREREAKNRQHQEAAAREMTRRYRLSQLEKDIGPRYSRELVTLESFKVYHKQQKAAIETVRFIAAQLADVVRRGEAVLLFGACGTGKDHLLANLLYRAVDAGFDCRYVVGAELQARIRDAMRDNSKTTVERIITEYTVPAVLAISDPFPRTGEATDWQTDVLSRIVDRRYRGRRSTWMTANLLTRDAADEAFTAPVWDRLQQSGHVIFCEWPSYRERHAAPQLRAIGN
jgi:DNA replication protein DnaC